MATSSAAGRFVIIAEFEVKADRLEEFLKLARTDASRSVANEPGCRQFDVTVDRERPNRVVLYEVYDDEAAFDAHVETPHLKAFRAGIEGLIALADDLTARGLRATALLDGLLAEAVRRNGGPLTDDVALSLVSIPDRDPGG